MQEKPRFSVLTLVAAKVLLDKIQSLNSSDNFSIETCLKSVNSGGKNLGFGGGFDYRNNTNHKHIHILSTYFHEDL